MSDRLIDLSDGWRGEHNHKKYLLLVVCPLCGDDWRDEYQQGEHDHDDVKAHFQEEHDGSEISLDHPAVGIGVVLKRQLDDEKREVEG